MECAPMTKIYPIIMVGGAGTRLWPVSTQATPKQFQAMVSEKSLLQETLLRFRRHVDGIEFCDPIIIGARAYLPLIEAQIAEIGVTPTAIILEPCPRSTTPVAAIAANLVADLDQNALALLVPSDHYIAAPEVFLEAVFHASSIAQAGWITTFGIQPIRPETGFGYISAGKTLDGNISQVATFTEKPNAQTAAQYLQSRSYSWNAGIFLFTPETMRAELEKFAPKTLKLAFDAMNNAKKIGECLLLEESSFQKCEAVSLDYSVMEKTEYAAVYSPLSCGWSDVGTWSAIADMKPDQTSQNVISLNNENCYFQSDGHTQIAATGLKDLIIIAHEGGVLVVPKERCQDVSKLVEQLHDDKKPTQT